MLVMLLLHYQFSLMFRLTIFFMAVWLFKAAKTVRSSCVRLGLLLCNCHSFSKYVVCSLYYFRNEQ